MFCFLYLPLISMVTIYVQLPYLSIYLCISMCLSVYPSIHPFIYSHLHSWSMQMIDETLSVYVWAEENTRQVSEGHWLWGKSDEYINYVDRLLFLLFPHNVFPPLAVCVNFSMTCSMCGMLPFLIAIAIGQPWKMLPAVIFASLLQLTSLTLSMCNVCVCVSCMQTSSVQIISVYVHVCGTCINTHGCKIIFPDYDV